MGKKHNEAHVRLYRHEVECQAYRSLSTDARALLIEFRALYSGRTNRIHMSIREAKRRLGVGRHRAEKALTELQDRGFIRLMEEGSFHRKVRHASVYALTSEPINDNDGEGPPKDYMRWRPPKNDGVDDQHRRC